MALIRVFEPANAVELATARLALDAAGIPFFVEGEEYFAASGGFISHGDRRVWIQVEVADAAEARQVLERGRGDS